MILNTLNRMDNYTDQILQQHGYTRLQITTLINSALGTSYNQENLVYNTEIVLNTNLYSNPVGYFGITNNFTCFGGNDVSMNLGIIPEEFTNQGKVSNNLGSRIFTDFSAIIPNFINFSQFKFV